MSGRTSRTYSIPVAAKPSRNAGDIPKAESPATHPALRQPRARACSSISNARSVFDRYRRRSSGTPAAAQRPASEVHASGRYKRWSARARPRGPTWARNAPAWQLAILPNAPQYCRATPTDLTPCLGKSLPSNTHTASGCSSLGPKYSCRRAMTASSSQRASVRNRCIARAETGTISDRFSALRRSWAWTSSPCK